MFNKILQRFLHNLVDHYLTRAGQGLLDKEHLEFNPRHAGSNGVFMVVGPAAARAVNISAGKGERSQEKTFRSL